MIILGFDTETTGLDPKIDEIAEVGAVLYDTDFKQPIREMGYLVKTTLAMPPEVAEINGISQTMIDRYGLPSKPALEGLVRMTRGIDFFAAHNAPYDRDMLAAWCVREGIEMPQAPWIDTATDLPDAAYKRGKSRSLKYLCCDHGIMYIAHRAVNDVNAMFQLAGMYDFAEIVRLAQTPNVMVRAVVSFDDRHKAKERGYYWKPDAKLWVKQLKADQVGGEKTQAPFPVVVMEASN